MEPMDIYPPKEPDPYLECLPPLLEDFRLMDLYNVSGTEVKDIDTTMLTNMSLNPLISNHLYKTIVEDIFATAEYPVINKKTTYKDRYNTCKVYTQNMKLLRTLEVDLISRGKDLKPFWTKQSKDISDKLWLPTKIDSVDSDSNLLKVSSTPIVKDKSWFSTTISYPQKSNLPKTFYKYLPSSQPELTDSESTLVKSRKIRIFPDTAQKQILKEWFGVSRWFYNRAVDHIENKCKGKLPSKFSLRDSLKNQETRSFDIPDWCATGVPERVISGSVMDCHKSYKSNFAKMKKKQIDHFKVHYRTKKQGDQSLYFPKECFGKNNNESIFIQFLKNPLVGHYKKSRKKIRLKNFGKIDTDTRFVSEEYGKRFFLCIPVTVDIMEGEEKTNIVSIDSGVRTFQTCYSPAYHVIEVGTDTGQILVKYLSNLDVLRSLIATTKNKRKKYKYRNRFRKISSRIKNMTDELHWKTINMLTKKYGLIMLSDFKVDELLKKRNLNKQSKRILTLQRHYVFRQRLVDKCKERNVRLFIFDESYTSKTCCHCGCQKEDLGKSKTYRCSSCGIVVDRDINGAVNMFVKGVSNPKKWIGGCALST